MEKLYIGGIPAILWGGASDRLCIVVHGQYGCKEDARSFAALAEKKGLQTLSIDLPCHGERKVPGGEAFPWEAVPELREVTAYARPRWKSLSIIAVSLGAYFSMLAWPDESFEKCLFVSPVLDMERLIRNLMDAAGISEDRLRREDVIQLEGRDPLRYKYLRYAADNTVTKWPSPTEILYASRDSLTSRATAEGFAARFGCGLTVMEGGEHWFHTHGQLEFLDGWLEKHL